MKRVSDSKLFIKLIKSLLYIIGFFKGSRYGYSQDYEDNFKTMDLSEKLWWAYKALVRQIENAEAGKDIEGYFARQEFEFRERDSFHTEGGSAITEGRPVNAESGPGVWGNRPVIEEDRPVIEEDRPVIEEDRPVNEERGSFIKEGRLIITAGGDLSCSEVISPESTQHLWDDVENFYMTGDIVCANLESPIDPSMPVKELPAVCLTAPALNTTPEMFERYARGGAGINFFSTANNHSLDQGEAGLLATLDFLDSKSYMHVGTSRTSEEQSEIPVIEKNGVRVAFISYTYCLNRYDPIPGKEYMTNVIRLNKPGTDISLIEEHVAAAHRKGADVIIALLHWSIEFETYPVENVIKMGHRIMECGVDIIIGGHPHVAQPMEKYHFYDPYSGHGKDGFIIYSLGELVSYNAFSRNSRLALLLRIELSGGKDGGLESTRITGIKVLPVYTLIRRGENGSYDYRLLDFRKTMMQLEKGINSYGFKRKEVLELKRLERLLYDKLLPVKHAALLDWGS